MEKIKKGFLKEINRELERAYEVKLPENLVYLRKKDKIYAVCKDFEKIPIEKMNVEKIGIKIASIEKDGIRLTIEGAQLLKDFKKNFVEIKDPERFLAGEDIEIEGNFDYKYLIAKSGEDILGVGKIVKGKILRPYIPKERRIPKKYIIGD